MANAHSLPLRRRPRRTASLWSDEVMARASRIAWWLVAPLTPYYVLKWIFNPRGQSLRTYLYSRLNVWCSYLVPALPVPETPRASASLPGPAALFTPFGNAWDNAGCDIVTIPPAPADMCGDLASGPASVAPTSRPGFMITPVGARGSKNEVAQPGEKIILFIHGGGYIRGHPLWSPFPVKLAKDGHVRAFLCQYRKTLTDDTAFPAPLLDALAAWHYVTVTLRFPPASVLLCGDSAGGHLTLALVQQLAALSRPQAGGLALCSPWSDFTFSFPSWKTNGDLDYLSYHKLHRAMVSAVRHYANAAISDPLFSPALAPPGHWGCLAGTPTLISFGTAEVFADEDRALIKSMRRDGVDVTVFEVVNGLHEEEITTFMGPAPYERFAGGVSDLLKKMHPRNV